MKIRRRQSLATVAVAILFAAPTVALARVDLAGRVLSADGSAVAKASVRIYTAAPRVGTSSFCPSCYPDCGKSRASAADGRFLVPALSDSLLFDLLVVAPGFEPTFARKVDPRAGPLEVRLEPRDPGRVELPRAIVGRVIDAQGRPVVGATLEPGGFHERDRSSFGRYPGTDPLAISDEAGGFALMTAQPSGGWDLRVRARDLAPAVLREVPVGGPPVTVRLATGATVTGRVLREGVPLAGVVVALDQVNDIGGSTSYGVEQLATDENGRFTFVNVTPGQDYWVYGTLESFRPHGVASSARITVAESDSLLAVAPLEVGPGHRISGRVRLSDGRPIPPGTRLTIARYPLGGAALVLLDGEGRFATGGIPRETVDLSVRVNGYRLARDTRGFQDRLRCAVVVDRDRDDIEVVLEPE